MGRRERRVRARESGHYCGVEWCGVQESKNDPGERLLSAICAFHAQSAPTPPVPPTTVYSVYTTSTGYARVWKHAPRRSFRRTKRNAGPRPPWPPSRVSDPPGMRDTLLRWLLDTYAVPVLRRHTTPSQTRKYARAADPGGQVFCRACDSLSGRSLLDSVSGWLSVCKAAWTDLHQPVPVPTPYTQLASRRRYLLTGFPIHGTYGQRAAAGAAKRRTAAASREATMRSGDDTAMPCLALLCIQPAPWLRTAR